MMSTRLHDSSHRLKALVLCHVSADCSGDANNAVLTDRKLSSYSHFSPDRASLELFLDIGVRLRQQLALLKVNVERLRLKQLLLYPNAAYKKYHAVSDSRYIY